MSIETIKKEYINELLKSDKNFIHDLVSGNFVILTNGKTGNRFIKTNSGDYESRTFSIYYNEKWKGDNKYSILISQKDEEQRIYINFKSDSVGSIQEAFECIVKEIVADESKETIRNKF